MQAAIYARTCTAERGSETTSISNQVAFCRNLAQEHNLSVDGDHIFTDVELPGNTPPTCWASENDEHVRPALSALVEVVERGEVKRILVRRPEKLGSSWELLTQLVSLLQDYGVRVIVEALPPGQEPEPGSAFALSILAPCLQIGTERDMERRDVLKAKKIEEIERLKSKISRLEAEISEL